MLRPSRPLSVSSAYVCWECRSRLASRRAKLVQGANGQAAIASRPPRRAFHATQLCLTHPSPQPSVNPPPFDPALNTLKIRERLKIWEERHGGPQEEDLGAFRNHPAHGEISNTLTRAIQHNKRNEQFQDAEEGQIGDYEDLESTTATYFLKPGDVVEVSSSEHDPMLGVFVQRIETFSQLFLANGRWMHSGAVNAAFVIPGCVDPALIKPIVPFLPTETLKDALQGGISVPRELASPIVHILQGLQNEAEKLYRENATALDNAYPSLADQTRMRMMTLSQIAKALLGRNNPSWTPTSAAFLAVRKALLQNEFRFRGDLRSQRITNIVAIRPRCDVEVIETVQNWIRQYLEHEALCAYSTAKESFGHQGRSKGAIYVAQFIEKARRLVAFSRQYRSPLASSVGPSKTRYPINEESTAMRILWGEDFSSTDKEIIGFLKAWVLGRQFTNMPSLHSACATLLRATGCYDELFVGSEITPENPFGLRPEKAGFQTGYLFLAEIGVIKPFENSVLYDESLMLPTVRLSRNLELLTTKAELTRRNPDFRDSMAKQRHDWGTLTVFCIDSPHAKEIDDGISISKVSGKDNEFWIHVHVANPTAFFDKTHVLSGLAAHMTETFYAPEQSFPMLPPWASQNYFSLARNRPVLTFSTRVDVSGIRLETKIQPGIIRNVKKLTPTTLAKFFGEEDVNGGTNTLVVGATAPPAVHNDSDSISELSPSERDDLRNLYTVARSLSKSREAAGGIRIQQGNVSARVYEKSAGPGLVWTPPSTDRARFVVGDPVIELTLRKIDSIVGLSFTAHDIVEEMMILACETAASWCAERNIPAMYRGTMEDPNQELSLSNFKKNVVRPYLEKHGSWSPSLAFRFIGTMGRGIAHSAPIRHNILGLPHYLKVTSPLRRFADMISHWQIEAALRYEAKTGRKFDAHVQATASTPVLPFSQRQIQESIVTLVPRERVLNASRHRATTFWALHAFIRAHYFNEAPLPKTFRVIIRDADGRHPTGYMLDFSLRVSLLRVPELEYRQGDEWETEIALIHPHNVRPYVRPIRLLKRDPEV